MPATPLPPQLLRLVWAPRPSPGSPHSSSASATPPGPTASSTPPPSASRTAAAASSSWRRCTATRATFCFRRAPRGAEGAAWRCTVRLASGARGSREGGSSLLQAREVWGGSAAGVEGGQGKFPAAVGRATSAQCRARAAALRRPPSQDQKTHSSDDTWMTRSS